jgi:polar amino acid transport system permease protein
MTSEPTAAPSLAPKPAAPAEARSSWLPPETRPGDLVALLLLAFIASLVVSDWPVAIGERLGNELFVKYWPRLAEGLGITLQLVAISIVIGALIGLPVAFARLKEGGIASRFAFAYVYFFRGTPLLCQIFLIYYGAGQFADQLRALNLWWMFREAYWCALISFTLNTAAYQAEIFSGAIKAVDRGQWEGGRALGLSERVIFWRIIVPQAMITALRPFGNEIILMIKGSAVASIVTVFDLMGATRLAFNRSYDFQVYLWAAVVYLLLVETLRRIWDWLERLLTRHLKRRS